MDIQLKQYYQKKRIFVNKSLIKVLPDKLGYSQVLAESMKYSVLADGKRLRALLLIAVSEMFGLPMRKVKYAACALELIHTYSLIHDDLPCMDNDDFRRGKLTNHKRFGEAVALLAGDALLAYAFELLAKNADMLGLNSNDFSTLIATIARSIGYDGMVGGQVVDMLLSMKHEAVSRGEINKKLNFMHINKTAALISASITAGGVLAKAPKKNIKYLMEFGLKIGLAFQVVDDILDETKTAKELGKSNSDSKNKKITFPGIYGLEKSFKRAENLIHSAKNDLKVFGKRALYLNLLADYVLERSK
ncbi:MAG: polyprenyl synthetase family protein [bacterium]